MNWVWYGDYKVTDAGHIFNKHDKWVKGHKRTDGYTQTTLSNQEFWLIHRLIAKLFVPNPNNLPEINHIDGNRSNNTASNLEWCDRRCNELDCTNKGSKFRPHNAVFTLDQLLEMKVMREAGVTNVQLGIIFKRSPNVISRIINGHVYTEFGVFP